VRSDTFRNGDMLPREMAFSGCGGDNESPQLSWTSFPPETRSFALTMFDPDAPTGSGFWHWLAWDIPATVTTLDAGAGASKGVGGGTTGRNDYGLDTYGGPCPPEGDGPHRYIITIYALDVPHLEGADSGMSGARLVFTMRGHVLATGTIEGRYER
jgi:Raf kinase inhibitor-like YbhB/YbcL family protein